MLVEREYLTTRKDGVKLYRSYSTDNMKIRKVETGEELIDAVDVESEVYTYEETDNPIDPPPETDLTVNDTLEILNEFGVDTSD